MRRGEVLQAIPDLVEAARNDDPAALTDLAAALVSERDLHRRYSRRGGSSRLYPSSRHAPALEAIAMLQHAIEQQPGLAAAHCNLGLALEEVGLTVEARRQLDEAVRLSDDVEWNEEARRHRERLLLSDQEIDRDRIQAYVEVTNLPAARRLLQPYLAAQQQRLRARGSVYPNSRALLAADTYSYGVDPVGVRLVQAMQTFCSGATAEPCATRYYTSGALYAAGRKSEATAWLQSIEDEIQQAHGAAGLRALQRWEVGLNMVVRGSARSALDVFEAQYAEYWASGDRVLAEVFDELRRAVRGYLTSEALFGRDTETAFRYTDDSSLRDVQNALAPDAAILRYATTSKNDMVVFVVRRNLVDVVTLPDGPHRSAAGFAVTSARMRIAMDPATAAVLHDLVVAPVLDKLHGISTIAVIPNFELAEIPFGALFDAGRGRYLAERFTIVHAPSAHVAVELSKRTRDFHDSTLLAIGATEFDRTQGETLAGVDREIA
ncbi:MAG TPA: CHAT domain-containing protein, partial [Thermoanaerobaculia bacterium]|nr:CHAT domain-containing protein [Thermoanaerobaculia bacterium]